MRNFPHLAVTPVKTRYDIGDEVARRHGVPVVTTACGEQVTNTLATRRQDLVRCSACLASADTRPNPTGGAS
jgi:hypothetical protein